MQGPQFLIKGQFAASFISYCEERTTSKSVGLFEVRKQHYVTLEITSSNHFSVVSKAYQF